LANRFHCWGVPEIFCAKFVVFRFVYLGPGFLGGLVSGKLGLPLPGVTNDPEGDSILIHW
jgi:hypothetical protein